MSCSVNCPSCGGKFDLDRGLLCPLCRKFNYASNLAAQYHSELLADLEESRLEDYYAQIKGTSGYYARALKQFPNLRRNVESTLGLKSALNKNERSEK